MYPFPDGIGEGASTRVNGDTLKTLGSDSSERHGDPPDAQSSAP